MVELLSLLPNSFLVLLESFDFEVSERGLFLP